ncbi:hypothetical protein [Methylobacterium sp. SyP6R]|uniref:hypothetical protein n=1 Tax=Methylobacterium sp. SyP6R TaxID=2718876 RepID=UPI001F3FABCE|nr:hypothetical protein [Methylobacterium sp. SyP6R]MCF4129015.1 hypothetical protein [Methylobacterium sp. SyP6R]
MGLKHPELRRRWQDMHHPVCFTHSEKLDEFELQEWADERGVIVHREVSYALRRERWSSAGRNGQRGWYALTDVLDCPDEAKQFEARLR